MISTKWLITVGGIEMALAKLINQLGLKGFGPDHYQTDMLAEHGTHTGAVVPLYERDALEAVCEANDLRRRGQMEFIDATADSPVPESWDTLATLQGQERT